MGFYEEDEGFSIADQAFSPFLINNWAKMDINYYYYLTVVFLVIGLLYPVSFYLTIVLRSKKMKGKWVMAILKTYCMDFYWILFLPTLTMNISQITCYDDVYAKHDLSCSGSIYWIKSSLAAINIFSLIVMQIMNMLL